MSLITIEQFEELAEDYPDLAQCYDLSLIYATDSIDADTCPDQ